MPVDSLTVFRIRQALWPSALTQSLWSFSKVLFWHDTSKIGDMLGMQTKPQSSVDTILAQAMKRSPSQSDKPKQPAEENATPPTATGDRGLGDPPHPDPNRAIDKPPSEQLDALVKTIKTDDQRMQEANDSTPPALKSHLLQAFLAFKTKFAQTWRPAPNYPPRGSILVSGLIELDSPKAWLVIDVRAAWDPKTKQYDPRSMQLGMRRLQMKRQAPLGGWER
jgi:hypothetical protein